MNIARRTLVAGAIAFGMAIPPNLQAQYSANFQTNIISGVTSNWAGSYYVGNTTYADALLIQSGGVLNDQFGYLGYNFGSSNNSAVVTDSGSIWSNAFVFYVGNNGLGNSLIISNGAQVLNGTYAYVGGGSVPVFSGNSVVITDTGSVWSIVADLAVGYPGAGNRVMVRNGGLLMNHNSLVGSYASGSSNNSLIISDAGSVWTNGGDLYIGDIGHNNSLTVSNGGRVFSGYGYVGNQSTASNNVVTVTGAGSSWTNRNDLVVGSDGSRNSFAILNSGAVYNASGYIGNNADALNNLAVVSGSGSVWTNRSNLYVGYSGSGNNLVVSNGGRVFSSAGTLSKFCGIGQNSTASNNTVLVSGPNSAWYTGSASLHVGDSGASNVLVITNAGLVAGDEGVLGATVGGSNNNVVVTGIGSVWSNRLSLFVGYQGSGNDLVISNHGQAISSVGYVGYYSASSKNSVLVSGTGSVWSNAGDLYVGNQGSSNSLVIQLTVGVINQDAYIGFGSASSGNSVQVLGDTNGIAATRWGAGVLHVGEQGSGNSLVVSGADVYATNLMVGAASSACDNLVELDSGSVTVTNATHDAVLEVRNGRLVLNGGVLQVDVLIVTNPCARLIHNGGQLLYSQLILDPNLSAVGDGIPNGWKQQYGLDPLDPNVANEDPDGDGLSNLQEYLGGGNPVADIQAITQEGNDIRVTWGAAPGKTNALQVTAGDVNGSYSTNGFADIFLVTNSIDSITNYLDVGGATNFPSRYYRVRLVP